MVPLEKAMASVDWAERARESGHTLLAKISGRKTLLHLLCSCGVIHTKQASNCKTHGFQCPACGRKLQDLTRRTPLGEISAHLESFGSRLIEVSYPEGSANVRFLCSCGSEVERLWKKLIRTDAENQAVCLSCSYKSRRVPSGEAHPNFNPLLSDEQRENKWGHEDDLWSNAVLVSADYTCAITGVRGERLAAHHLWSRRRVPALKYDLENGLCLAYEVHRKFHTGSRSHTFTPMDLVAFAKEHYGKSLVLPERILSYIG